MYNPIVSLLVIAAAAGTVFTSETPNRGRWVKVDGAWSYMPKEMAATVANPQPTTVPQIILPLSESPPMRVTVLPRFVKGGRNAVRESSWEGEEEEGGEEGEGGYEEEKGDEEEEGNEEEDDGKEEGEEEEDHNEEEGKDEEEAEDEENGDEEEEE